MPIQAYALAKIEEKVDEVLREVPDEGKNAFEVIAKSKLRLLSSDNKQQDRKQIHHFFFDKIYKNAISEELGKKAQHIDRLIDLLFFFRLFLREYKRLQSSEKLALDSQAKGLEEKLRKQFWYFQQQGELDDLDSLRYIEKKADGNVKIEIVKTENMITNRSAGDLLEFFSFDSETILSVTKEMISNREGGQLAKVPDVFAPQSIVQAFAQLREIDRLSKDLLITEDMDEWLNTGQKALAGLSPREAVLHGKGFRVLQILIQFGEGIF